MNRIFKYALMFAFVGITIFALSQMSDGAEARTATWDGGGADNLASTKENWDTDVAPIAGDAIVINTGSKAITWNIDVSLTTFDIGASYSGTITQSSNMNIVSYSMLAGRLTGSSNYWITCSGSFERTTGTIDDATVNLKATGTGNIKYSSAAFYKLWVTGSYTGTSALASYRLVIDGSLAMGSNLYTNWLGYTTSGQNCYINGTITGTTGILFYFGSADRDIYLKGTCYVPMEFKATAGATASRTCKLLINANISSLGISSLHSSNTMTLDVNDYDLSIKELAVGTRGILQAGTGDISCSVSWDDTNGTFTSEIGNVILNGTGYCHTDDPGTFYNLRLEGTTRFIHAISTTGFIANGQWTGRVYYNGTTDISTNQQHWTGWLYTQNDIAIEYNAYAYLAFNHDAWLGIQLNSWSGTDNFTWNATSVASQTVQWSWSRGESSAMYDEYEDTIYIGSSETNAGGMGTFTSTFTGTHAFLLSRSTFLPASTDIDDSVWLGILFMSIATILNFVGYVRKIGLLQIVAFLVLLVGVFSANSFWEDLWTMPALFILSNAVLFVIGMIRRG